jgi:hypothetical protein
MYCKSSVAAPGLAAHFAALMVGTQSFKDVHHGDHDYGIDQCNGG